MKTFHGFDELLKVYKDLGVWWIFTKRGFINNSREDILTGTFYVPENDDEEEESYATLANWLETQTFEGIIINKLEHHPESSRDDLIEAAIYYLEQDDFLD
ncbi:hypothetical protein AGMMS49545_23800 [Betaproteobacteria bacterium]|nr:hypothetical protein AGMMS49545_23800 [Betaproteobacteria bacterium]GHU49651.1 hypothetical protein AGMMS50289_26620 [Betaproteobacteria bacterium]